MRFESEGFSYFDAYIFSQFFNLNTFDSGDQLFENDCLGHFGTVHSQGKLQKILAFPAWINLGYLASLVQIQRKNLSLIQLFN